MFAKLRSYLPTVLNLLATGALLWDAHVRDFAAAHITWSGPILLIWGVVLHWLRSPRAQKLITGAKN